MRRWHVLIAVVICAGAAPRAAAAQNPAALSGPGATEETEKAAFGKLDREFQTYLASQPGRSADHQKRFYREGKRLIAKLLNAHIRSEPPYSVYAYCRIPLVVEHVWGHRQHAKEKDMKWIRDEGESLFGYKTMCKRYSDKHQVSDRYTRLAVVGPPIPPRPTFPSVVPCRPADLILDARPSAARLKQCARFVRAEIRRLLRSSRRHERNKAYVRALSLVERAVLLAPKQPSLRRRSAELKARMGDATGAMQEVEWWRREYGDVAADDLREVVVKLLSAR